MTELHYMSATAVLRAFRTKDISPVEALEAVSARADAVEPVVNALLERGHEDYVAQAQAAADRYARREPAGLLDGLPVVMGEQHPIAGRSLRYGSLVTEDQVACRTEPIAERMLSAGAVVHARTTTPEFSCAAICHSELWGVTRNPWNPAYGPGGSSGGSGAALASGTAYLASGSDGGGSLRIPASMCGVVGFKAPYGRVPTAPPHNLDTYCHEGAMGRTVADVALLHNVIQGQHPVDHASLPAVCIPDDLGDVRGLRVGLAVTLGDLPVEAEIVANTIAVGDVLRWAGACVREVSVDVSREQVRGTARARLGATVGAGLRSFGDADDERLMPYTRQFLGSTAGEPGRTGLLEMFDCESAIARAVADAFDDVDVIITPTVGTYGYLAGEDYLDGIEVAGEQMTLASSAALTSTFNIASRHPVLNVPSGLAPNGVPTGVQIAARPYDDVTAFQVGAAVERELGLWTDHVWRPLL